MKQFETAGYKRKKVRVILFYIVLPIVAVLIKYKDKVLNVFHNIFDNLPYEPVTSNIIEYLIKINHAIDRVLLEFARPLEESNKYQKKIGLTTANILKWFVILSIFVGAFKAEYLRQKKHKHKTFISKITPNWSFHFFQDKPKTGNIIIGGTFLYTLFKFYQYLYYISTIETLSGKSLTVGKSSTPTPNITRTSGMSSPLTPKFIRTFIKNHMVAIIVYTSLFGVVQMSYFYDFLNIKKKHFNYSYLTHIKTKTHKSNESGRHLVKKTIKIPYTTVINRSLLALPVLYMIYEVVMFMKDNITFKLDLRYILFIVVLVLVVVYRNKIKLFYLKHLNFSKKQVVLFKGPQYLSTLDIKEGGLPINLGDYKSINQKFNFTEINNNSLANSEYCLSFCVWLDNFDTSDTFYNLLSYNSGKSINDGLQVQISSSQIRVRVKNNNMSEEPGVSEPDFVYNDRLRQQTWHCIKVNVKNNRGEIFINDELVAYKEQLKITTPLNNRMILGSHGFLVKCAVKDIIYYPESQ